MWSPLSLIPRIRRGIWWLGVLRFSGFYSISTTSNAVLFKLRRGPTRSTPMQKRQPGIQSFIAGHGSSNVDDSKNSPGPSGVEKSTGKRGITSSRRAAVRKGTGRSFIGGRRSFIGGRRSFIGGCHSFVGGHHSFIGSRRSFIAGHRPFMAGRRSLTGDHQSLIGGRRSLIGGRRSFLSFSFYLCWRGLMPRVLRTAHRWGRRIPLSFLCCGHGRGRGWFPMFAGLHIPWGWTDPYKRELFR